jgi:hypothetical protein
MVLTDKLKRSVTLTLAALLFLASLVPLLTRQKAGAYALLPTRSITMSTSQEAATSVTYHVRFDIATTSNLGGLIVEFCSESPIIGDTTCTGPTGFDIGTPTVSGQSDGVATDPVDGVTVGDCNLSTITTAADLGATNHTLELSNATPVSLTSGQTCFFDLTTATNPSTTNSTFYARIYTYATQAAASGYTLANPAAGGAIVDAGGIAMSTAQQITITSKVQERLTFCVYTTVLFTTTTDNNCSTKTGSTISLGDTNGVLDSAGAFVDKTAYYSVTTNASGAAAIRMKGDTLELTPACAAATCRIEAIGAAEAASTPGTEQFGFCTYQIDGTGMTIDADYDGTNGVNNCSNTSQTAGTGVNGGDGSSFFAFNTTNTTTLYGDPIASKPAGAFSTGNLVFIGNIADTTEPGIYTTTLTFVATGTY